MVTVTLIVWPLIAAVICLLIADKWSKSFAVIASILELVIAGIGLIQFKSGDLTNTEINWTWISNIGANFHVGIDGISWVLVLLTVLLFPFIIGSTEKSSEKSTAGFYSLILIMQAALVGVFVAKDAFLFYVFWELALIPIYFICLRWGGENRKKIFLKFFIYTLVGSLFMLVAFIYIYTKTPLPHNFDWQTIYTTSRSLSAETQALIFWGLFIAFAIKMPIIPFHTWQPDTYHNAPTQGTMLLSGIMLKMGTYGVIRWLIPLVPLGMMQYGKFVIILSVVGLIYASCIALVQSDLKRLLAYSSIAHVGLIAAGSFTATKIGLQGALIQMVSHGIIIVALFYIVDIIYRRTQTYEMDQLGGIRTVAPKLTSVMMIVIFANIALPLTSGFVGEFLLLSSVFKWSNIIGAIAGVSIVLGAVYMLSAFRKSMLGNLNQLTQNFKDLTGQEKIILFTLALLILVIGIYPSFILSISEKAVEDLTRFISATTN